MCDDHDVVGSEARPSPSRVSRRGLLAGAGASFAAAGLSDAARAARAARAPGAVLSSTGTPAYSMAMHVHSSFSEQSGSMQAQLLQAQSNAVDVLWWTDHDHRMSGFGQRSVVHFTSLTNETTDGPPWQWQQQVSGSPASSSGGIVSPGSPRDPIQDTCLSVNVQSSSTAAATLGYYAQTQAAQWNERSNLYGLSLTIDVLPQSVGADGYLEVLLSTSRHPARNGRPAGTYTLSYRVGGTGAPGSSRAVGLAGIVTLAAATAQWNTLTLTPCNDIAELWPDMDYRDFALTGITLNAVSTGRAVNGCFDFLRFTRQHTSGTIPLQTQQGISAGYAAAFSSVAQRHGLEMGPQLPHLNWFGGTISLPDYQGVTSSNYLSFMAQQVDGVHSAGGLASYNHPFGVTSQALLSQQTQDAKLAHVATTLLTHQTLGCDILEVGYVQRAGIDLAHHVGLWDVLSRNAMTLTGNGVNDDHNGVDWYGPVNNWVTSVWAPTNSEADLLGALAAGRAWTGTLRYQTTLDLLVDGVAPMGSVSVSSLNRRQLTVSASGLPSHGSLRVVQGDVDYAGTADPTPNSASVAVYPDTAFGSGSVTLGVDTSTPRFVRVEVLDAGGAVTALSNPVWLLHQPPPNGIKDPRGA